MRWLLIALMCLCWPGLLLAQQQPSPVERLRRDVALLVDPELLGRGFEGEGHVKARDLIVERMQELGLEPAGDDGGWLVAAPAVASAKPGPDVALKVGERVLGLGAEFMPLGCSGAGAFDGALVFVGQGAQADWPRVDVTDRVALVWASEQPVEQTAALALAHGARALLIVTYDAPAPAPSLAFELGGMPAAYVAASAISGVLDALGPGDKPRAVPGAPRASGELGVTRRQETVYNVVGRLPGTPASGAPLMLGAHYDHLGLGEHGSLGERGALHAGADDNASGVAVLLEVARRLRAAPPDSPGQPVLFVAFGGEEVGLRGARRLAARLRAQPGRLVNLDMVGRLREGRVYAEARADSTHLALSEVIRAGAGLGLMVEEAERAHTSDAVAFADVGFETLHLTTGRHAEYHAPGDTADLLDYEGAARIAALVELLMRR